MMYMPPKSTKKNPRKGIVLQYKILNAVQNGRNKEESEKSVAALLDSEQWTEIELSSCLLALAINCAQKYAAPTTDTREEISEPEEGLADQLAQTQSTINPRFCTLINDLADALEKSTKQQLSEELTQTVDELLDGLLEISVSFTADSITALNKAKKSCLEYNSLVKLEIAFSNKQETSYYIYALPKLKDEQNAARAKLIQSLRDIAIALDERKHIAPALAHNEQNINSNAQLALIAMRNIMLHLRNTNTNLNQEQGVIAETSDFIEVPKQVPNNIDSNATLLIAMQSIVPHLRNTNTNLNQEQGGLITQIINDTDVACKHEVIALLLVVGVKSTKQDIANATQYDAEHKTMLAILIEENDKQEKALAEKTRKEVNDLIAKITDNNPDLLNVAKIEDTYHISQETMQEALWAACQRTPLMQYNAETIKSAIVQNKHLRDTYLVDYKVLMKSVMSLSTDFTKEHETTLLHSSDPLDSILDSAINHIKQHCVKRPTDALLRDIRNVIEEEILTQAAQKSLQIVHKLFELNHGRSPSAAFDVNALDADGRSAIDMIASLPEASYRDKESNTQSIIVALLQNGLNPKLTAPLSKEKKQRIETDIKDLQKAITKRANSYDTPSATRIDGIEKSLRMMWRAITKHDQKSEQVSQSTWHNKPEEDWVILNKPIEDGESKDSVTLAAPTTIDSTSHAQSGDPISVIERISAYRSTPDNYKQEIAMAKKMACMLVNDTTQATSLDEDCKKFLIECRNDYTRGKLSRYLYELSIQCMQRARDMTHPAELDVPIITNDDQHVVPEPGHVVPKKQKLLGKMRKLLPSSKSKKAAGANAAEETNITAQQIATTDHVDTTMEAIPQIDILTLLSQSPLVKQIISFLPKMVQVSEYCFTAADATACGMPSGTNLLTAVINAMAPETLEDDVNILKILSEIGYQCSAARESEAYHILSSKCSPQPQAPNDATSLPSPDILQKAKLLVAPLLAPMPAAYNEQFVGQNAIHKISELIETANNTLTKAGDAVGDVANLTSDGLRIDYNQELDMAKTANNAIIHRWKAKVHKKTNTFTKVANAIHGAVGSVKSAAPMQAGSLTARKKDDIGVGHLL